jgi:O-antigen ligase
MLARLRRKGYSHRAWLVALYVACAIVLGGGGTPNPTTEIILQLVFATLVVAWIWLGRREEAQVRADRWTFPLIALILALPIVQLVPLPPALWQAVPGRADAAAALELVGAADAWRPLSLSPSRTLASLLAMVPAAFCIYGTASLTLAERRLVILAIVVVAVAGGLLGMIQLLSGGEGLNFYRVFSRGWVTGFQANRNAEADVLLIALLALAVLVGSAMTGDRAGARGRKPAILLGAAVGVFLLVVTVLTGSRAGMALALLALAVAGLIIVPTRDSDESRSLGSLLALAALPVLAGLAVLGTAVSGSIPVGRALARFGETGDPRIDLWQDTMFAISQYWPAGVGMGGFGPTILAAERLEFVNRTFPNRAHNDYLEIGLESGLFGYLAVVAAGALVIAMAIRSWRALPAMRRQILFGLGALMIVGLHSAVDYPLRSMALASLAGIAAGMVACPRRRTVDEGLIEPRTARPKG